MKKKRILIVGAGEAGNQTYREIQGNEKLNSRIEVIGFIDDDAKPASGLKPIGCINDLASIISDNSINELLIAIPTASRELIHHILNQISEVPVDIRIVPGYQEIILGNVELSQIRSLDYQDLLGREEVPLEPSRLAPFYKDKSVLITGAGGSIGGSLVRQILQLPVKAVVGLGRGEHSMFTIAHQMSADSRFTSELCDIQNSELLEAVLVKTKPDIIIHTAAYKHVSLMEKFPTAAIKNNIFATNNLLQIAVKNKIKNFVFISTDKAVNPSSVMGMSKRIGELLTHSYSRHYANFNAKVVRFGNVLGSTGSVVEIFQEQIKNGNPLTVTDAAATRYFLSKKEAARLLLKAAILDKKTTYYLDMGQPIKIVDLAVKMLQLSNKWLLNPTIKYIGLRPGEKLHESLTYEKEKFENTSFDRVFALKEAPLLDMNVITQVLDRCELLLEKKEPKVVRQGLEQILNQFDSYS